jgi:anthraniloyl-CoA monooxygenase
MKAATWYGTDDAHCPPQYFRNSARDREELMELQLKAKLTGHRGSWKEAAE